MKYKVAIIETLQKEILIDANSSNEAINKVKDMYDNCDIVLDSSNFIETEFEVID